MTLVFLCLFWLKCLFVLLKFKVKKQVLSTHSLQKEQLSVYSSKKRVGCLLQNNSSGFILFKPHLHGRLFCNAIRRFFMRENLSRRVVTHTRRDSLTAIAFGKNLRRVSNTCDLRCQLYFARLDARIVLARDHLHKVDFNVSRVSGQSRARVNSKSYAIYESPRHSAMHKCFASRWLRLP